MPSAQALHLDNNKASLSSSVPSSHTARYVLMATTFSLPASTRPIHGLRNCGEVVGLGANILLVYRQDRSRSRHGCDVRSRTLLPTSRGKCVCCTRRSDGEAQASCIAHPFNSPGLVPRDSGTRYLGNLPGQLRYPALSPSGGSSVCAKVSLVFFFLASKFVQQHTRLPVGCGVAFCCSVVILSTTGITHGCVWRANAGTTSLVWKRSLKHAGLRA